jgi:hypothetical protein
MRIPRRRISLKRVPLVERAGQVWVPLLEQVDYPFVFLDDDRRTRGFSAIRSAERPRPKPTSKKFDPYSHNRSPEANIKSRSQACMACRSSNSKVTSEPCSTSSILGSASVWLLTLIFTSHQLITRTTWATTSASGGVRDRRRTPLQITGRHVLIGSTDWLPGRHNRETHHFQWPVGRRSPAGHPQAVSPRSEGDIAISRWQPTCGSLTNRGRLSMVARSTGC